MSQMRQRPVLDRVASSSFPIATLTRDYRDAYVIPLHFHDRDQLVYASSGVMTVRTRRGAWVVPPNRAVWIPARTSHTIAMSGRVSMRTLYLRPRLAPLPRECCVVNITSLLKELIHHVCTADVPRERLPSQRRMLRVIVDQLETLRAIPLQLPAPTDHLALAVSEMLNADPGDQRSLAELCKSVGASKRTIERAFRSDVGMSLGSWRQQLRLMHGLRLLAGGASVTHAALESGYNTPSSFIAMFKRVLGTTPSAYFQSTHASP